MNHAEIYANPLYNGTPGTYSSYEIHRVGEYYDPREGITFCEQADDDNELDNPDFQRVFFSIYGHIDGFGLECIGDFDTAEGARDTLKKMGVRK